MVEIQWIGKDFRSLDDVDPVIVERDGKRVSWGEWGFATVRPILPYIPPVPPGTGADTNTGVD